MKLIKSNVVINIPGDKICTHDDNFIKEEYILDKDEFLLNDWWINDKCIDYILENKRTGKFHKIISAKYFGNNNLKKTIIKIDNSKDIRINDKLELLKYNTNMKDEKQKDNINPFHYKQGDIECIDALKSATVNKTGIEAICTANVIKYLWRYEAKAGIEDVKKAQWYLNRLLKELEDGK